MIDGKENEIGEVEWENIEEIEGGKSEGKGEVRWEEDEWWSEIIEKMRNDERKVDRVKEGKRKGVKELKIIENEF